MITAKEAKTLYDESGAEVEQFLKHTVEPEVTKAAKGGKRQVMIHLGNVPPFNYVYSTLTPLQTAVVDKLKGLGYRAEIKAYGEKYVPRGLADDDGNGPQHQNYGIQLNWNV